MARLTHTHTLAEMPISAEAYDEIKEKLEAAGYQHAIWDGLLDMHGIGLSREDPPPTKQCSKRRESGFRCGMDEGHIGQCGPWRRDVMDNTEHGTGG